jgi:hypothetical protein
MNGLHARSFLGKLSSLPNRANIFQQSAAHGGANGDENAITSPSSHSQKAWSFLERENAAM